MQRKETIIVTISEGKAVLHGRTFPVRDILKDSGARWDAQLNSWVVSATKLPDIRRAAESRGVSLIQPKADKTNSDQDAPLSQPTTPTNLDKISTLLERIATALETIAIELLKKGG